MIPTAQNVCGPLCGYTIEELRVKSVWAPGREKVGAGYRSDAGEVSVGQRHRGGRWDLDLDLMWGLCSNTMPSPLSVTVYTDVS